MPPPTDARLAAPAHAAGAHGDAVAVPARRATAARRRRAWRAVVAAVLVGGAVLSTAGCGLRVQTPPPAELTPDADEAARQRATADAMGLEVLARTALPGAAPAAAVVLQQVVDFSAQHADRLGGPYVSGLPTAAATGGPSAHGTGGVVA